MDTNIRARPAPLSLPASPPPAPEALPLTAAREELTPADYEEVLAGHRRLVRELDVLLNGKDGAAKQASLGDIVSQVRREGITIDNDMAARYRELGAAIERAAGELPEGYELRLEVEQGAGTVALYDPGCTIIEGFGDGTLAAQIGKAIDHAHTEAAAISSCGSSLYRLP